METTEVAAVPKYLILTAASRSSLSLAPQLTAAKIRTPSGPSARFSRVSQDVRSGGGGGLDGRRRIPGVVRAARAVVEGGGAGGHRTQDPWPSQVAPPS